MAVNEWYVSFQSLVSRLVLCTWRRCLVSDSIIRALWDRSVTDGHHSHEVQDDSRCRLKGSGEGTVTFNAL